MSSKTHTITKIKTNNKTKEREGNKQGKRGEREREERDRRKFFGQLHMNCCHFLYMAVASWLGFTLASVNRKLPVSSSEVTSLNRLFSPFPHQRPQPHPHPPIDL